MIRSYQALYIILLKWPNYKNRIIIIEEVRIKEKNGVIFSIRILKNEDQFRIEIRFDN